MRINEHQEYERQWWGDCTNTFSEEARQITYAHRMGLVNTPDSYTGRWPQYDMVGKSILDLGGGPSSMLLKTVNADSMAVVDPCPYPEWTRRRYALAGIVVFEEPAESFSTQEHFDEVWIYNVLQHVDDPSKVIDCAKKHGSLLRIFDWVNTPPSLGHPHTLTKSLLDDWIGGDGEVGFINENSALGEAYYGAFSL